MPLKHTRKAVLVTHAKGVEGGEWKVWGGGRRVVGVYMWSCSYLELVRVMRRVA